MIMKGQKLFFYEKKDECNTYRINKEQILFPILPPIFPIYYRIYHIFMLYSQQRTFKTQEARDHNGGQDCSGNIAGLGLQNLYCGLSYFSFHQIQAKIISYMPNPVASGVLVINGGSMAGIQVDIHPSRCEGRAWRPFWHVIRRTRKLGKGRKSFSHQNR